MAQNHLGYAPKTVIFKVKPEYRSICELININHQRLDQLLGNLGPFELSKIFPNHEPPTRAFNNEGNAMIDISLIYELSYSSNNSLDKLIHAISNLEIIDYAQHRPLPRLLYTPNDDSTKLASQYFLNNIQAYAAWDINKGDTNVVIGITDTGVDPNHLDLKGNIKYNYEDTIDGVDNDNDGFIDNFRGWDMANNDNDPTSTDTDHHGTRVAGIAAESTDNSYQGAGVGFKCKFLPIKIQDDLSGYLTKAYEGIVYAADHGCQIINCSWGDTWPAGQFERDIVNYATINKNALIIAAAGNSNADEVYYPAAIKHVISVGGTNLTDEKWIDSPTYGSTYNRTVDITAPSPGIATTKFGGGFNNAGSGTSFASPIVAGCAAIVRSQYPNFSAIQIGEQLKVTADSIYQLLGNILFNEKLGSGRVNLFKAVTDSSSPSIVMIKHHFSDGNDERFIGGDTIRFTGTFKNYLAPTAGPLGVFVNLSSISSDITIIQSTVAIGNMNSMDTIGNYSSPLTFRLESSVNYNQTIELRFEYTNETYSAVEYVSLTVNPSMVDITENNISTSLTNQIRIGYEDSQPLVSRRGLGFQYKGEQLIFEAGFMVGAQIGTSTLVSDNVWDSLSPDADFTNLVEAQSVNSTLADFEAYCQVDDKGANSDTLNVKIDQFAYAWANAPDNNYIMLKYRIINTGGDTLKNLFAGINADWDLMNFEKNRSATESGTRMGYVKSTEPGSPYVAIKLLSKGPFEHYAIDNIAGASGIDIFYPNAFTTSKKYTALSTSRLTAGVSGTGNDVIDVVSTGPFTVAPSDTITVSFAMLAGDDLLGIVNIAKAAQAMYDTLFPATLDTATALSKSTQPGIFKIYPNPSSGLLTILASTYQLQRLDFELFDLTGTLVYKANISRYSEHDLSNLRAGIYTFRIHSDGIEQRGKLVLVQ